MKKLSLDDLRVESYASQVSEQELAEVKGGTSWACLIGPTAVTLIYEAYRTYQECNSQEQGSSGGSGSSGGITYKDYGSDSTIVCPDGTIKSYGSDSTKFTINH